MRRPRLPQLLGLLLGVLLAVPFIGGHASSLHVDGGVLQTWVFDVDIEPEPVPTVDVAVEVREYSGKSGNGGEVRQVLTYKLPAHGEYWVEYSMTLRDCQGTFPADHNQTGGPFTAATDLTHVLCVQRGQPGVVRLKTGSEDGPVVTPLLATTGSSTAASTANVPAPAGSVANGKEEEEEQTEPRPTSEAPPAAESEPPEAPPAQESETPEAPPFSESEDTSDPEAADVPDDPKPLEEDPADEAGA